MLRRDYCIVIIQTNVLSKYPNCGSLLNTILDEIKDPSWASIVAARVNEVRVTQSEDIAVVLNMIGNPDDELLARTGFEILSQMITQGPQNLDYESLSNELINVFSSHQPFSPVPYACIDCLGSIFSKKV